MKYTYLMALAGLAVAASTGLSQTVSAPITNPSFETPTVASGNYFPVIPLGTSGTAANTTLPGWTAVGNGDLVTLQDPSPALTNEDGKNTFEDTSSTQYTGGASLYQVLTTTFSPGTSYLLTAYAGTFANQNPITGATFFIANSSGTVLASSPITGTTQGALTAITVPFTSTGLLGDTGAIEIGYTDSANQGGASVHLELDNFSLTATTVPEPSSIAIAALGGFGLLGAVLRRRRA